MKGKGKSKGNTHKKAKIKKQRRKASADNADDTDEKNKGKTFWIARDGTGAVPYNYTRSLHVGTTPCGCPATCLQDLIQLPTICHSHPTINFQCDEYVRYSSTPILFGARYAHPGSRAKV